MLDVQELIHEYNRGDRDFSNIKLHGIDLGKARLSGAVLSRADLSDANLQGLI